MGKMANRRVVVVGAGIAGLSAALRIRQAGAQVTVFESSDSRRRPHEFRDPQRLPVRARHAILHFHLSKRIGAHQGDGTPG